MPRVTKTMAFASYGATCANYRWSWSARSADGKAVVLVFWEHRFRENSFDTYCDFGWGGTASVVASRGNKGRKADIEYAECKLGSIVRVVMATARDPEARPFKVKKWRAVPDLAMRVTRYDPASGQWAAERVR